MSILNRSSDGLISVLIALRRTLLAYGRLDANRLLALAAPASAVEGSKQARQTLTRWTQLGMFTDEDGIVGIAPPFDKIALDDVDGLRRALIRAVMSDTNNPSFDVLDAAAHDQALAADFTKAACWALAQDIYAVDTSSYTSIEALQNAQIMQPAPFVNDTRWQGFVDWSVFLGFSSRSLRLLFEPHFAVAAVLDDVFASKTLLPIDTFLTQISVILPVLDRGRFRIRVEANIQALPYALGERDISISLSAALLHLEQAGIVHLETRSDATTYRLLGHRACEVASISHVQHIKRETS
jgi:hypothetical protein